jgi:hypothetical protein
MEMMKHLENASASDLVEASAGELLDAVYGKLQASNAISSGYDNGLISSLDYQRLGATPDAVGPYSPSTDGPRSLNIRATFASERPMANKYIGTEKPGALHVIVEWDDRYDAATGDESLRGLSRLALAVTCLAAENVQVPLYTVYVRDGMAAPRVQEYSPAYPVGALKDFDDFINKPLEQAPQGKQSTLVKGLNEVANNGLNDSSDVCVVISDFVSDAEFNVRADAKGKPKKHLDGFGWESSLQELHSRLDDRLFSMRLITPAQTQLPYAHDFAIGGRGLGMDTDEYLQMSKLYERVATIKQNRLAAIFRNHRVLDLSSTDYKPFVSVADFVFGSPEQH